MFARMVSAQLKVNQHKAFPELFHNRILSMLRNQRGFRDVMLLVVSGAPEVVAISFWDSKEAMDAFNTQPQHRSSRFSLLWWSGHPK